MRNIRVAAWWLSCVVASACAGALPTEFARVEARAPQPVGPLPRLVPGSPSTVIVLKPALLYNAPGSRPILDLLFPSEVLEAFRARTGVELATLQELVIASYARGTVVLVRGPFRADIVVREAGTKMTALESQSDEPFVRRSGLFAHRRYDLSALDADTIACVIDEPGEFAALLRRLSMHREDALPPAGAGLASIPELVNDHEDAPLVLYAPAPLELPPSTGVGVLFAGERALAATLDPAERGVLRLTVDLRGQFPEGASDNFRALLASLAESELGGALGLREGLESFSIQHEGERVVLRLAVPTDALATGTAVLFGADLRTILSL